jgi:hypothetical protein
MKRDEREYVEDIPEATRKARLEEEATTLLSLPKDIRKMVMMKLKPIDMYALYSGVDNYAFKKWCDDQFWDYALRAMFPDVRAPEEMVHPRWRFFAYALAKRLSRRGLMFEKPYSDRPEMDWVLIVDVSLHNAGSVLQNAGRVLHVSFDRHDVSFGSFLIQLYIEQQSQIPIVERNGTFTGSIEYVPSDERNTKILYRLFTLRYKLIVRPGRRQREFLLGCHLCGSPVVAGYAKEDPTKLLCGRECVNK